MSYCTLIYGLNVQLNKKIPGVVSSELSAQTPDVEIELGSLPSWFDPTFIKRTLSYSTSTTNCQESSRLTIWELTDRNTYHLCYADGTQFLVDKGGTQVWATWPSETLTLEDTATYLLGPIMGFVLLLRGRVSLHASAVVIGDSAVAFVGPAGAGKSTTAAALADLGYRVLSEDVVTLDEFGDSFLVQPGYPCIRLWPESVEALYGSDADLPKLTPTWEKRFVDLTQKQYAFQHDPLPLSTIYLVNARSESSDAPFVETMSQSEALMSLVSNTYATHLMNRQMRAREFDLLTRLLKTTSVRRLIPHSDPARILALCRTIVNDFESFEFRDAGSTQPQGLHV